MSDCGSIVPFTIYCDIHCCFSWPLHSPIFFFCLPLVASFIHIAVYVLFFQLAFLSDANFLTLSSNIGTLLTYFPCSRVHLEKRTGFQLVKKFSAFYGTWRFITTFTRSILILSSHLCLSLSNGLFPSGLPMKTLYMSLLSPIHATCPTNLILLNFITRTMLGEEYGSLSSSLFTFLNPSVTSFI